ncbi:helix-turn-helix transcriptional regulator [Chryseobacterium ginsenosidimutans]|uniref:helix-turn-helix domain-containing protein n=1 Tax=Chryseobacterium ginsenosidimutans TaxID=687846 RepID=UPI0031E16F72
MNSVGFKIKRLRERKNISQEELAYKLDVSQGTLSKMENGMVERIDFSFMQKVCDYFEVDPSYFLNGDTIINNVHDNENNGGVMLGDNNGTINNFPEEILKNQEQIAKLIEVQNKLIEKLLGKNE